VGAGTHQQDLGEQVLDLQVHYQSDVRIRDLHGDRQEEEDPM
jgi:hypothetical protein